MNKLFKRITSAILAGVMMISTMITASAENETVIIDGFECYQ